jgi:perosamine synthetase
MLAEIPILNLPTEKQHVKSNWHLYPLRVKPNLRGALLDFLAASGVGVLVNYIPGYRHPVLSNQDMDFNKYPNSKRF